jgi:antitoxin (DNA-binding transcriptional repressor) of toxin-antitoxin stability system
MVLMTTLTITDAKRNLGRWLNAAIQGEDVGILAGSKVVALRPVEVEATDYAWREYGVTPEQLDRFIEKDNARVGKLRRQGKFIRLPDNLEDALETIAGHRARRTKAASRPSKRAARKRRVTRA